MDEKNLKELSEVIQSSNINFLFGAGTSTPFLPMLGNIEEMLDKATNAAEKEIEYKRYFDQVMLPNKSVIDKTETSSNYVETATNYDNFFTAISDLILRRKTNILSKQVNIFTSNIDILLETSLERLLLEYNDGFSGKFNPIFSPANFKKSILRRSLHYDHTSEIPVFNIIKFHGSLTWLNGNNDEIVFSHNLEHINATTSSKTGTGFLTDYQNILVVNPQESKHLESVLNLYYSELLRMYSSELEKEHATLFVLGFSMADKHIREITLRASKANPTLRIFICCSQPSAVNMNTKMETTSHPNIKILTPENASDKFSINSFVENVLNKIGDKE